VRVGIIQSSYIPWRGYFDFIASVDMFVFHENIQYTKGDWRNRNQIKTPRGLEWLTVPVNYNSVGQLICDTTIDSGQAWVARHIRRFQENYKQARFLEHAMAVLEADQLSTLTTISQLNMHTTKRICAYLNITTPMVISTDLMLTGSKTERLLQIIKRLGGDVYLTGPTADAYLDKLAFKEANISLEYKSYDYPDYPQLWGEFNGKVSVLDMIANCGPESPRFLRSISKNRMII
jgi:hypothetical protein